jgi:oligopeptide transport system permease protein
VLIALLRAAHPIPPGLGFVLALGVLRGVEMARLLRGEMLRVGEQEFVLAARALGVSGVERVRRHILPHALSPLLVSGAFCAAMVVGLDTALGLLGLGGASSFGALVGSRILSSQPAEAVLPALAAALTTAALYVLADALDDALSERRRLFGERAKGLPTSLGLPR